MSVFKNSQAYHFRQLLSAIITTQLLVNWLKLYIKTVGYRLNALMVKHLRIRLICLGFESCGGVIY